MGIAQDNNYFYILRYAPPDTYKEFELCGYSYVAPPQLLERLEDGHLILSYSPKNCYNGWSYRNRAILKLTPELEAGDSRHLPNMVLHPMTRFIGDKIVFASATGNADGTIAWYGIE